MDSDLARRRLLNERASNVDRGEALAELEASRDLTSEEATEFDTLLARRADIDRSLARIEAQREGERTQAAIGTQQAGAATMTPIANIQRVHDRTEDKPWGTDSGAPIGEYLVAIARSSNPMTGFHDPRLRADVSGASQGIAADGGFLVEEQFSTALLNRARESSQLMGLCRTIPIGDGYDSIELPIIDETSRVTGSRWGGVQVYRKAEADTVTASKPKLAELKIEASELMGLAYATERLLNNAPAIEALFTDAFTSEFAFKIDDEIINGTGVAECLGILNANSPTVSQAKDGGQAAATITPKNLDNMWVHMPSRLKGSSVWLYNSEAEPELGKLFYPVGTSGFPYRFVNYDDNGVLRIHGRPAIEIEQCAALGTVGDIILANMGEYILSPKGGIQSAQSMHVRFLYNEMTFRWNYYINGRPAWKSSVTPYKGSATISPFVSLATRA